VKASAKVAESLFRKAVGDGLRQFSARAPTPNSCITQANGLNSHYKNRPKRFCRSMPVGTPVDVSSWRISTFPLGAGMTGMSANPDIVC
jgi:hypothetical protein